MQALRRDKELKQGISTVDQRSPKPELLRIIGNILLIFSAIILPGTAWSMFGWLHGLLPLVVFIFICRYGVIIGGRFIVAGGGLAALAGMLVPALGLPLFSFSMIPAGYLLARSGLQGDSPAFAGLKGGAAQIGCWALLIAGLSLTTGVNPYGVFLETLNSGIDEALSHYRQSGTFEPDAMMALEATLYQMKVVLPIIMPAIFVSFALATTWLTMVAGNRLAARFLKLKLWPGFRTWQLPDRLIWLAIACAIPALLPGTMRHIAVNLLIVLSVIYCFQGFAVCVFFMNKWRVPPLIRSFLYVMIVLQSVGTLVLLTVGIADVWFDFRKLGPTRPITDEQSQDD